MSGASVSVRNLRKAYSRRVSRDSPQIQVLGDISFEVRRGDFVAIMGPNGCGKTTLLKTLMGFERQDAGSVSIFGKAPEDAKIGYVPQNTSQSLYPWLTSLDNVAFAHHRHDREGAMEKLREWGIPEYAGAYPYELSGGLKQLVSIARATFFGPDVFLLDEPFNSLDYQNRFLVEKRLLALRDGGRNTAIMISHDIESAVLLCDRIIVLSEKPARIRASLPVPLAGKRTIESRFTPEFESASRRVFEILQSVTTIGDGYAF